MTPWALALESLRPIDFVPFLGFDTIREPLRFSLILLLVAAFDAAWISTWLVRGRGGVDMRRIAWGVALFAVVFVVRGPVLALLGVGAFGLITVAWYDLFLVTPLVALVVLLRGRREGRVSPGARMTAWLALLMLPPVAAYARFIEPYRLQVETAAVVREGRETDDPIRVAVLADLQTDRVTAWEHHVIDELLNLGADIIVLPGDLYHGSHAAFAAHRDELRALLARLQAPGGVYFARGDVDDRHSLGLGRLFQGTSIRWLEDEAVEVEVRGRRVTIAGLARSLNDASWQVVRELEERPGDDVRIVVAHYPRAVGMLRESSRIDVVVAGHTHGGQISLPWFGPPITLSPMPRRVGAGGLHVLDGRRVYVSRGAGLERGQAPRIRFLCPPEVTLLRIR